MQLTEPSQRHAGEQLPRAAHERSFVMQTTVSRKRVVPAPLQLAVLAAIFLLGVALGALAVALTQPGDSAMRATTSLTAERQSDAYAAPRVSAAQVAAWWERRF